MPPLIHKFFLIPEILWNTEGFLHKGFRLGPVRQKISIKPWCPPPSYAWKFSIKEFFWNTEVFSDEIFWYSQTKTFRRKIFSVLWNKKKFPRWSFPPSFAWKFSIPEFFRNTEVFSYEFYRHCETKIFQRSLVISPSYAENFAIHEIFWNTELLPNEIFRYCVTKVFDGETWYPPSLIPNIFRYPKFSDTPKCSNEIFRYCETKNFERKVVIPPPLCCIKNRNQWWNWCL